MRKRTQPNRADARAAHSEKRRRRRRGKRTLHYLLFLVFVLAVGLVLSMTVLFKIEQVRVIGVDRYTPDAVAEASGVRLGDNLLRIDKAAIEKNLCDQFPYIDDVQVRRKLPPALEITVVQAQPAGAILLESEVLLIDRNGKVLERGLIMVPEGIPIVKGIDAQEIQPGEVLGAYIPPSNREERESEIEQQKKAHAEQIQEKLVMLRYLLEAMETSGFENLTNVDLTDRLNIRVMYEGRILLELGSENQLDYKLSMAKEVLEKNIGPDEKGTLDATDASRSRVVFRPEAAVEGQSRPTETVPEQSAPATEEESQQQ